MPTKSNKYYAALPTWAPLYLTPPSFFSGNITVGMLCRVPSRILKDVIPPPLSLVGTDLIKVNWTFSEEIRSGSKSEEPFIKNMTLIEFVAPVSYQGITGEHCFLEYLDSDAGMAIGRETWGWPKKMGTFDWNKTDTGFHLAMERQGIKLAESVFEYDTSADVRTDWPAAYKMDAEVPNLQVRDRSDHEGQVAFRDVMHVLIEEDWSESLGVGKSTLKLDSARFDPLKDLEPLEVLGAEVSRNDFKQPFGSILNTVAL